MQNSSAFSHQFFWLTLPFRVFVGVGPEDLENEMLHQLFSWAASAHSAADCLSLVIEKPVCSYSTALLVLVIRDRKYSK